MLVMRWHQEEEAPTPLQLERQHKWVHPEVPLALKQLPKLDAVVISHDHYDHLDMGTVKELVKLQAVPFITSLGVGAHLQAWGVPAERIVELDWWEHWQYVALGLRAAPKDKSCIGAAKAALSQRLVLPCQAMPSKAVPSAADPLLWVIPASGRVFPTATPAADSICTMKWVYV